MVFHSAYGEEQSASAMSLHSLMALSTVSTMCHTEYSLEQSSEALCMGQIGEADLGSDMDLGGGDGDGDGGGLFTQIWDVFSNDD